MPSQITIRRLTIKTLLSVQEAETLLEKNTGESRHVRLPFGIGPKNKYLFTGIVFDGHFNISRAINYGNGFKPVVLGQFYDDLETTRIEIHMRLSYAVPVFIIFAISYMLFIDIVVFETLSFANLSLSIDLISTFVRIGTPALLFYAIIMGIFNYEARRTQRELEKLFPS